MSVNPSDAAFVRDLVRRRAAIQLDAAKDYLIEMRLTPLAIENGLSDIAALVQRARLGTEGLETKIVEAITTHETSFYRDMRPFETLRKTVLPDLIQARAATRRLFIWCAACSSGQEPYSLSMLLQEHFPQLADWKIHILATDVSEKVIARARSGSYSQAEMNRGLPPSQLAKYFERQGTQWQLKPEMRRLIEFRQMNLLDLHTYPVQPDIVLIRNVLIYFDVPTKRLMLDRVRQIIAPGGVMLLGAAESTLNVSEGWQRFGDDSIYKVRQ